MRHDCSHFPKSVDAKFSRIFRGVLFLVIPVLTFFPAAGFDEEPVAGKSEVPKSAAHEVSRTVPPTSLTLQQKISAVHYRALTKHPAGSPEIAKEVEDGFRKLIADYPNEPLLWQEMLRLAEDAGSGDDKKRILTEIVKSGALDAKEMVRAKAMLKAATAVGQPLEIAFAAVDGRKVDLQGMKGKVVLVDFWAAWCVPCMAELPRIVELYNTWHEKEFEIVGINLDSDQSAMDQVLRQFKIPWPQYFDGKRWGSKYAVEYNIGSIPAMWLVDKKGILRTVNAREDLESRVKELLAEEN
jgi:thiol-disulfide isomerase/thioredoxin